MKKIKKWGYPHLQGKNEVYVYEFVLKKSLKFFR